MDKTLTTPSPRRFSLPVTGRYDRNPVMNTRIAIGLALIIIAILAVDAAAFGGSLPIFLGRKFFVLLDWLAFWR